MNILINIGCIILGMCMGVLVMALCSINKCNECEAGRDAH